jgi:hypothetical protein
MKTISSAVALLLFSSGTGAIKVENNHRLMAAKEHAA